MSDCDLPGHHLWNWDTQRYEPCLECTPTPPGRPCPAWADGQHCYWPVHNLETKSCACGKAIERVR